MSNQTSFFGDRLSLFRRAYEKMIATSSQAYRGYSSRVYSSVEAIRPYKKDEVLKIIESGTLAEQRKLSRDYFYLSGIYHEMIMYKATMLKYTGVLIPNVEEGKSIKTPGLFKRYNKALNFIDNMNVPSLFESISEKILINGCYYGLILSCDQEKIVILDLPPEYCCSRYKNFKGLDLVEFNLHFFDSIIDEDEKNRTLKTFPRQIRNAYSNLRSGKITDKWYIIPSEIGICFPLSDGRPPYINIIPSIIDYDDYIELEKSRDEDEIKKILIQKIPHTTDGKLVFEPDEAEEMHVGAVEMMRENKNVNVLTTYADVDVASSQTTTETSRNNIEKIYKVVYGQAGITPELFASTGSLTADKSIKKDLAFMMSICKKYDLFITEILNKLFSNPQISFNYKILPVSYFNETDYVNNTHKLASSGYSFILPALGLDLSQREITSMKNLENDALKLREKLIPLSTSYTESASEDNEGGAPVKSNEEKSDKTAQNIEAINNGGVANGQADN